jgi:hypothetical protein
VHGSGSRPGLTIIPLIDYHQHWLWPQPVGSWGSRAANMCVQSGTKGGGAKGRPSFVMQPEVVPEDHEITFASPDYMPGQLPSPGILKKLESRIAAQVRPPPPPICFSVTLRIYPRPPRCASSRVTWDGQRR